MLHKIAMLLSSRLLSAYFPMSKLLSKSMTAHHLLLSIRTANINMVLCLLTSLLTLATTNASSSFSNSITVASCRASCLHVFTSPRAQRDAMCRKNSDCFMCWNSCGILRHQLNLWSSMCTDHTACLPGCQVACRYYMRTTNGGSTGPYITTPPPPLPAYLPPPTLSGRGQITWGGPDWSGGGAPFTNHDILYVVLVNNDRGWREVVQTSSTSAALPSGVGGAPRVRILAVTQEGLVAASEDRLYLDFRRDAPDLHNHRVKDVVPVALPDSDTVVSLPVRDTSQISASSYELSKAPQPLSHQQTPYDSDDKSHHLTRVDPTWTIEVVKIDPGPLMEITVSWAPRGSTGVEYLLSWMEESGSVSGHLLTDQVTSELSLWPGQGYFVQVELIDSQGNAVIKSAATPIRFTSTATNSAPVNVHTTTPVTSLRTSLFSSTRSTSSATEVTDIYDTADRVFKEDRMWADEGETIRPNVPVVRNENVGVRHTTDENINNPLNSMGTLNRNSASQSDYERETQDKVVPPEKNKFPIEISSQEIHTTTITSSNTSHVLVWCVGVSIGLLLILTICSMVIWSLGKCRKSTQSEEYFEEGLSTLPGAMSGESAKQNPRNPATSWTFENFCSSNRKSKLPPPSRRAPPLPVGIDNASLVENYVVILESPDSGNVTRY